jgi:Fe-S cluster assembly iron-binding protein IscA
MKTRPKVNISLETMKEWDRLLAKVQQAGTQLRSNIAPDGAVDFTVVLAYDRARNDERNFFWDNLVEPD